MAFEETTFDDEPVRVILSPRTQKSKGSTPFRASDGTNRP